MYLVASVSAEGALLAVDLVFGALLGAAAGSYLGCVAYRLPRRLPLGGRSHCPACGAQLRAAWMVPVASWLAFRGRARCCGARLRISYLLFEACSVAAGAAAAAAWGWQYVFAGVIALTLATGAVSALTARRG